MRDLEILTETCLQHSGQRFPMLLPIHRLYSTSRSRSKPRTGRLAVLRECLLSRSEFKYRPTLSVAARAVRPLNPDRKLLSLAASYERQHSAKCEVSCPYSKWCRVSGETFAVSPHLSLTWHFTQPIFGCRSSTLQYFDFYQTH